MKKIRVTHTQSQRRKGVMLLRVMYFLAGVSVAMGSIVFGNYYYCLAQGQKMYQKLNEIHIEHIYKPNPSGRRIQSSRLV